MSPRPVVTERRQEQRKRPLSLVYVELSSANGGMLRDLSELGFAMRAMMPLHVGEITPFRFSLDESTRLEGRCNVLWVEDDGRVAGMLFTDVTEKLRAQVGAWLGEKQDCEPAIPPAPVSVDSQASTMEELREELRAVVPRPEMAGRAEVAHPMVQALVPKAKETIHEEPVAVAEAKHDPLPAMDLSTVKHASEMFPILESLPPLGPLPVLEEIENSPEASDVMPWMSRSLVMLAVRMMLVLAVVAVGIVYHRPVGNAIVWLGQKIEGEEAPEVSPTTKSELTLSVPAGTPSAETSSSGTAASPVPASEKMRSDATAIPAKKIVEVPTVIENPPTLPAKSPSPLSPVPLPATNRTTTFSPPGTTPGDAGQQEYFSAQDILKNKNTNAGLPEAVRLLWIAVEKGNSNAEVALAELYRQGRGVAKNCDQTQILLSAAARKGSAEAQKRLDEFLAAGCE